MMTFLHIETVNGQQYALFIDQTRNVVVRMPVVDYSASPQLAPFTPAVPYVPPVTPVYTQEVRPQVSHASPEPTWRGVPINEIPIPEMPAPKPPVLDSNGEMPRANPMIPPHFQVNKMFVEAGQEGGDTEIRRV